MRGVVHGFGVMDPEMQRRFEEHLDAPEARDLPLYQRNSYARLRVLDGHDLVLVLEAPLSLGFSETLRLPDGSTLEYVGEVPDDETPTPEIVRALSGPRHRYAWRVSLPDGSVEAVSRSYRTGSTLAALLSFATEVPVQWRDPQIPANVQIKSRHPDASRAHALLENLLKLPTEVQHALEHAAGWYSVGVRIGEPGEMRAYEFLSYWNVVESIADALGADPLSSEAATAIRDCLLGLFPPEELNDVVRGLAYRRTLRTRVTSSFRRLVHKRDAERFAERLFQPRRTPTGAQLPSLYSVRNEIAHGVLTGASAHDDPLATDTWALHQIVRDLLGTAASAPVDGSAARSEST